MVLWADGRPVHPKEGNAIAQALAPDLVNCKKADNISDHILFLSALPGLF
jgi:hypothetical protein